MPAWEMKPYLKDDNIIATSRFYRRVQNGRVLEKAQWVQGIKAIQSVLHYNKENPGKIDAWFGIKTENALKSYQSKNGLAADGIFGPKTAARFFRNLINDYERKYGIPGAYLCGLARLESAYDPAASNISTREQSFGLVQINLLAHTTISFNDALYPAWNLNYAANRMRREFDSFRSRGAGTTMAWKLAIAQHNSPLQARQWFQTGSPPSEHINFYVNNVQRGC